MKQVHNSCKSGKVSHSPRTTWHLFSTRVESSQFMSCASPILLSCVSPLLFQTRRTRKCGGGQVLCFLEPQAVSHGFLERLLAWAKGERVRLDTDDRIFFFFSSVVSFVTLFTCATSEVVQLRCCCADHAVEFWMQCRGSLSGSVTKERNLYNLSLQSNA